MNDDRSWVSMGDFDESPELDERDAIEITAMVAAYNELSALVPRLGDFVIFSDGVVRRVSHVYPLEWGDMAGVQTSDGGSWSMNTRGGASFSGALWPSVPMGLLTLTDELRYGPFWTFHHGQWQAHNGVTFHMAMRVYTVPYPANKYGSAAWEMEER